MDMTETGQRRLQTYVLVTAAYNEEKYIRRTIESVAAQSIAPRKWIIVSDASSDRTDNIVREYAMRHSFIALHRITEDHPRNFAAQVNAINFGCQLLKQEVFDFIGNLDADICFAQDYFERLFERFGSDEQLGCAGGFICEESNGSFRSRTANSETSVAHAIQLFRRSCFDAVGPYMALPYGGPDWVAETRARQLGWKVRAFPDLHVHHLRPTASAEGLLCGRIRQGRMDYSFGSLLPFELLKCARRVNESPRIVGSALRLYGYFSCLLRGEPTLIPEDLKHYLQHEQRQRLRDLLRQAPLG
jgi:glycosyltransferase involved in cell wall biosynthesis